MRATRRIATAAALCSLLTACEQVAVTAPSNTVLTAATHTMFDVTTGAHAVSCDTCHAGYPTFAQFSCFNCHGHEQSTSDAQHAAVPGYHYDSASCYACHQGSTSGGGLPTGLTHDPSKDVTVNAQVATFAGTTIAALSPQAEQLPQPMDHASTQFDQAASASCSGCHADAATGSYFPGTLHSALANLALAQPSGCNSCHATSAPTGLVGPDATSPVRTPPSGEMKHDAVAWSGGAATRTALVTQDCAICHASPSATLDAKWSTALSGTGPAQFHAALTTASIAQPASCLDCHANSRPAEVLTSTNSALPPSLQFDHGSALALADCTGCHATGSWSSWQGGKFHLAGSASPTTCLPCHEGERPTSTSSWKSAGWANTPFDYVTNSESIGHGDGQDCAQCHSGPGGGAWGGTPDWTGGHFAHGAASVAGTTCVSCHTTQRPDLQPGATAASAAAAVGFDHSTSGTGDCFGCHQATITAGAYVNFDNPSTHALPGGDWKGGQSYPGSTLTGSTTESITITEIALTRASSGGPVTGATSTSATLYNEMLHVSAQVPAQLNAGPSNAPDNSKCWHCHANNNGTVTIYAGGKFHTSLTNFKSTPGGTTSALPQPTSGCKDCHTQMRPANIVEGTNSDLIAMDHAAKFTGSVSIGGSPASGVADIDCSACHHSPGNTWTDGLFHPNIDSATPADCTQCHYPLMADASKADLTSGTSFAMRHRSAQVTIQACQTCHAAALSNAATVPATSTLWQGGLYHPSVSSQPAACVDCHAVSTPGPTQSSFNYSLPAGGTSSNGLQWMNHTAAAVVGKDCAVCHATDAKASGAAWSKSVSFHGAVASPTSCQGCHGLTNGGGSTAGANNNLPSGISGSSMVSSAGSDGTTGIASGTLDQIIHTDVNVTGHDCNFCHTQVGRAASGSAQGKEWAQASFHKNFGAGNALVINGTTGRCSNCHMNVKPTASFTAAAHAAFTDVSGSEDCSQCHSWPGTGTASAPNWLGASGLPTYINVGGFAISQPPASGATTEGGIASLPHPTVATGGSCTPCHATSAGGKNATGYTHTSSLGNNCNACHEAGTNLLGTVWNKATSQGSGAGDSRPYTLTSVVSTKGGGSITVNTPNHFYPVNCLECHVVPSGNGNVTTGSSYNNAWTFPHNKSRMTNSSTCNFCHR